MASEDGTDRSEASAEPAAGGAALASAAVRGGRFLAPLARALSASVERIVTEFNVARARRLILKEHSVILRHAILGLGEDELAAVAPFGWRAEDFRTAFFDAGPGKALLVLGVWADATPNLFRHKASGMIIPYRAARARGAGAAAVTTAGADPAQRDLAARLEAEFKPFAYDEAEVKFTMRLIFSRVPEDGRLFVLRPPATRRDADGAVQPHRPRARMNQWCAEAAELYPNVRMIDLADFADEGAGPAPPSPPESGLTDAAAQRLARHMIAEVQAQT